CVWAAGGRPPGATAAGPAVRQAKGKDLQRDPLPAGAVLRLGTLQQRAVGASLAVSADGKSIVGVRAGKVIRIWDAATGELRHKRELPGEVWSTFRISPDGRWVLRSTYHAADEQLEVWDVQTGKKVRVLAIKGARYIMPVAFSADGKRVAAVGHRRAGGAPGGAGQDDHLVRAWDLATGKQLLAIDVRNNVSS